MKKDLSTYGERCYVYLMKFGFVNNPNTVAKYWKDTNRVYYTQAMEELHKERNVIKTNRGYELSNKKFKFLKGQFIKKVVKDNEESFANLCKRKSHTFTPEESKQILKYLLKNKKAVQEVVRECLGNTIIKPITKNRLKNKAKRKIKDKLYEEI